MTLASAPSTAAPACDHLWHEDADDEGRTFKSCVRRGGCGKRVITGTTATRW